ncbi:AP2 domain-containing protein [Acidovorax sp. SUPP2522]|uniref:hypothetical protein n=1 Tax=unclassified Acidovorax TaxID=2684926 RepID=UPI0023493335|nr:MULTISPECIES: hypothetical protein [unclassified Acidovorax]WCM96061.1 hypothetical protein M5C96_16595 [Acidovorax sp. GBBC 1281]GKT19678.1 AP2 domain-containing protein [Acidovorax sp. SUPP2522]
MNMKPFAPDGENPLLQGMYGICRSYIKKLGLPVWIVRFRRDNRNVGLRYFYDHRYPSSEAALEAAKLYRNELLLTYPPVPSRLVRQRLMKNNTSGVAGVTLVRTTTGDYWTAATRLLSGKTLTSRFAVKIHGEDVAKRLAIAERYRQLQQVDYPRLCDPQAMRFFIDAGPVPAVRFIETGGDAVPGSPTEILGQPTDRA